LNPITAIRNHLQSHRERRALATLTAAGNYSVVNRTIIDERFVRLSRSQVSLKLKTASIGAPANTPTREIETRLLAMLTTHMKPHVLVDCTFHAELNLKTWTAKVYIGTPP
jgi:hypothetical protein